MARNVASCSPELTSAMREEDMISASSSQKYPGAGLCLNYVSIPGQNLSGQTVGQYY